MTCVADWTLTSHSRRAQCSLPPASPTPTADRQHSPVPVTWPGQRRRLIRVIGRWWTRGRLGRRRRWVSAAPSCMESTWRWPPLSSARLAAPRRRRRRRRAPTPPSGARKCASTSRPIRRSERRRATARRARGRRPPSVDGQPGFHTAHFVPSSSSSSSRSDVTTLYSSFRHHAALRRRRQWSSARVVVPSVRRRPAPVPVRARSQSVGTRLVPAAAAAPRRGLCPLTVRLASLGHRSPPTTTANRRAPASSGTATRRHAQTSRRHSSDDDVSTTSHHQQPTARPLLSSLYLPFFYHSGTLRSIRLVDTASRTYWQQQRDAIASAARAHLFIIW